MVWRETGRGRSNRFGVLQNQVLMIEKHFNGISDVLRTEILDGAEHPRSLGQHE